MKIRLLMLGKTRREECRALIDDYAARIRRYAQLEITELRDASKLKLDSAAQTVFLDAAGKHFGRSAGWDCRLKLRTDQHDIFQMCF